MPTPTTHTLVHPARPGTRRLDAAALWAIPRVGGPVPSPNGRAALVAVTTYDTEKDKGRARIWLVPADGSAPRALTAADADAREPAWSPDGTRICFTRKGPEKDAKPQVHVMAIDGGEAEKVTDLPVGCFDARFTPDGRSLVFGVKLLRGFPTVEATKAELERREKEPCKAQVTEDRLFRFWDAWLTDGDAPHLFRLDLATRALTDLMPSSSLWFNWNEPSGQYDISPDGSLIAFSALWFDEKKQLLRTGVHVVATTGGEPRCLTADHPDGDFHPRWTPDGTGVLWGSQDDPYFYADRVRLLRWDRASGNIERVLDDWRLSPAGWSFASDGTLWFECEDDARVTLYRWRIGGGRAPERVLGHGATSGHVSGMSPASDGSVWFTHGSISAAPEVHRLPAGADEPVRLSNFTAAALDGIAFGEVRDVRFEGAAGATIQAYAVFPPGRSAGDGGPALPLVHVVHGGPHGISGDQFHPRWNAHVFAHPGHVVVMVNFHGSTSWGQEFAQCIQGVWGERPYEDVMRGTDAILSLGWCDPARMAVMGASYGGYLVTWIAGHTDRFRCIVNHAGVSDSWSQYGSDVTMGRARSFGGEPWDRTDALDRWSPVRYAHAMTTPMLVTHGERDYRVPIGQGIELYSILKAKGVPARLVYFPDENHWILKPRNSLLWHREVFAWLARWLAA